MHTVSSMEVGAAAPVPMQMEMQTTIVGKFEADGSTLTISLMGNDDCCISVTGNGHDPGGPGGNGGEGGCPMPTAGTSNAMYVCLILSSWGVPRSPSKPRTQSTRAAAFQSATTVASAARASSSVCRMCRSPCLWRPKSPCLCGDRGVACGDRGVAYGDRAVACGDREAPAGGVVSKLLEARRAQQ